MRIVNAANPDVQGFSKAYWHLACNWCSLQIIFKCLVRFGIEGRFSCLARATSLIVHQLLRR